MGQITTRSHLTPESKVKRPPLLGPSNSIRVLTCTASLGSGWCICSALLPAASCAPAAADSCCSQEQLPGCLPLQPGRPGNRSRGYKTRSSRASLTMSSRGPTRKSWFCWSRDADCRASCPSWRRDGGKQEEEEEEEKKRGGGDGDGPAAAAGKISPGHKWQTAQCVSAELKRRQ